MVISTKIEIGTIVTIVLAIAGALVWIGTLQGSVNQLDKNEIYKQKTEALKELEDKIESIKEREDSLEVQYIEKMNGLDELLEEIADKQSELDYLIKGFGKFNSEDNREIILNRKMIKLEEYVELTNEEVQRKEEVYLHLKKHFELGVSSSDQYAQLLSAKSDLDNARNKLEDRKMTLLELKGKSNASALPLPIGEERYKLTITTDPIGSNIRVLNIKPKYSDGMELPPGTYRVTVSKFKYITKEFDIEITNRNVKKNVELKKAYIPLYVNTEPRNATVKILSIKKKYKRGILLEPGNYKIQVSKRGYKTKTDWISIKETKKVASFTLQRR